MKILASRLLFSALALLLLGNLTGCSKKEESSATQTQKTSKTKVADAVVQSSLLEYAPADAAFFANLNLEALSANTQNHIREHQKAALKTQAASLAQFNDPSVPNVAKLIAGFTYLWSAVVSDNDKIKDNLIFGGIKKSGPGNWSSDITVLLTPGTGSDLETLKTQVLESLKKQGFQDLDPKPTDFSGVALKSNFGLAVFIDSNSEALRISSIPAKSELAVSKTPLTKTPSFTNAKAKLKLAANEQMFLYVNLPTIFKELEVEQGMRDALAKDPAKAGNINTVLNFVNNIESLAGSLAEDTNISAFKSRLLLAVAKQGLSEMDDLMLLKSLSPAFSIDADTIALASLNIAAFNSKIFSTVKQEAAPAYMMLPQLNSLAGLDIKASNSAAGASAEPSLLPSQMPDLLAAIRFSDEQSAPAMLNSLKAFMAGVQCQPGSDSAGKTLEVCPTPFGVKLANQVSGNNLLLGTEPAFKRNNIPTAEQKNLPSGNLALIYLNQELLAAKAKEALTNNPAVSAELLEQFSQKGLQSSWLGIEANADGFALNALAQFSASGK
jgi:hypothetical protein